MKNRKQPFNRQKGFTLIEIVVVMVILGVLATFAATNIFSYVGDSKIQKSKTDINTITQALELYKLDNSRYPTTDQGIEALVSKPDADPVPKNYRKDGYLKKLPLDAWDEPYKYAYPGEKGKFDIYTLGADGVEGGEEQDADIGNWDS